MTRQSLSDRDEHLVLVRVWRERGERHVSEWRGLVEHIPSASRRYFTAMADLVAYIAERREQVNDPNWAPMPHRPPGRSPPGSPPEPERRD